MPTCMAKGDRHEAIKVHFLEGRFFHFYVVSDSIDHLTSGGVTRREMEGQVKTWHSIHGGAGEEQAVTEGDPLFLTLPPQHPKCWYGKLCTNTPDSYWCWGIKPRPLCMLDKDFTNLVMPKLMRARQKQC